MHQDLLNDLINSLTILPGVGKKSAQRMALYLLDKNKDGAGMLAKNLEKAIDEIGRCSRCRMLTSNDLCKICIDTSRDMNSICVVENPSDVLAIESTGGFKGRYFVLLGRLSPIEGISPEDLGINDFLKLIKIENIKEVAGMIQRLVPDAKIGIGHGQLDGKKLEELMLAFMNGEFDQPQVKNSNMGEILPDGFTARIIVRDVMWANG